MKDNQAVTKPIDYVLTETTAQPTPHLTFSRFIKLAGLAAGRYTAMIETRDMVTTSWSRIRSRSLLYNEPMEKMKYEV